MCTDVGWCRRGDDWLGEGCSNMDKGYERLACTARVAQEGLSWWWSKAANDGLGDAAMA